MLLTFHLAPEPLLFDTTNPILGNVGKIVGFGLGLEKESSYKRKELTNFQEYEKSPLLHKKNA